MYTNLYTVQYLWLVFYNNSGSLTVRWRFDIECAAECSGTVQRNLMTTNLITVQLLFEYNSRSLFFVDDEL